MRVASSVAALLAALTACGFVHDERIDGPYRLSAIDVDEEMSVCYDLGDACVGRIPGTVFAVGSNAAYVVAARHPANDRSRTEYYYLIRELDGPLVDPSVTVRGPFDLKAFQAEAERLGLPAFERELSALK